MYNTECFTYNDEEFELLREKTHLGFISKLIIWKRKKDYDKHYKLYPSFPNRQSDFYLEPPQILEYDLRLKKWIKSCISAWEKYIEIEQDGCGLDDFSKKALKTRKIARKN